MLRLVQIYQIGNYCLIRKNNQSYMNNNNDSNGIYELWKHFEICLYQFQSAFNGKPKGNLSSKGSGVTTTKKKKKKKR